METGQDSLSASFKKQVHIFSTSLIDKFIESSKFFLMFNSSFFLLFFVEVVLFTCFYPKFSNSSFFAFTLGAIVLTLFSYLILLFYFLTKKPEQLLSLKDQFIRSCRSCLTLPKGKIEHHLSICSAIFRLIEALKETKNTDIKFMPLKKVFNNIEQTDLFILKELLLISCIQELLEQIRNTPTDIEVHASLATTYVNLSKLYINTQKNPSVAFINKKQKNTVIFQKFQIATKRALEEFIILNEFAPNDPWVHLQLAKCYQDLNMPKEQVYEYEKIITLRPNDLDILFHLGVLYFHLSENAKGLKAYDTLKKKGYTKADELISNYGKENFFDINEE